MKIRLHQFLSKCGRFKSKEDIKLAVHASRIIVGDLPCKDLAYEFNPAKKKVMYDDELLTLPIENKYFVFYKPVGYICSKLNTQERELGKKSIYDFFADKLNQMDLNALHNVGRLDEDTSGLLIMTTDGKLGNKIADPDSEIQKTYVAELERQLSPKERKQLEAGVELEYEDEDGWQKYTTKPCQIQIMDKAFVAISITEGKKRQIRSMFATIQNHVHHLHRKSIGKLDLEIYVHKPGMFKQVDVRDIQKVFL
jgi:pseudouridine synthase